MAEKIIQLTDEQKKVALENAQMQLSDLTKLIFDNPLLDGRDAEGKAVKFFLAGEKNIEIKTTKHVKVEPVVLSDENKKFIDENLEKFDGKNLELTRLLFSNDKLSPLSKEFKAVYSYIKENYPDETNINEELVSERTYRPPLSLQHLIGKVNQYLPRGDDGWTYDAKKLKQHEEKCMRNLHGLLKNPVFIHQASQFEKQVDRILFESNFIRFCHDKLDLTTEEVQQYISLCAEIVNAAQIERTIQKLDREANSMLDDDDSNKKVLSTNMVEMINVVRQKWDSSKERIKKLFDNLTETRAKRTRDKNDKHASVLNIFDAFQQEKTRLELIEIAELEKKADAAEVDRLSNMDDVMALIAGMTKEEAKH